MEAAAEALIEDRSVAIDCSGCDAGQVTDAVLRCYFPGRRGADEMPLPSSAIAVHAAAERASSPASGQRKMCVCRAAVACRYSHATRSRFVNGSRNTGPMLMNPRSAPNWRLMGGGWKGTSLAIGAPEDPE
jgi:hypothetical protein